jgi:hypothetical protein
MYVCSVEFLFSSDEVDVCSLILTHHLSENFAQNDSFDFVIKDVYEQIYRRYIDKCNTSKSKSLYKKSKCLCQ